MHGNKKAVVVDDDVKVTMLVEKALTQQGFRVFSAQEGRKALELVEREKPDVLITDILQPGIDGAELCNRVKNDPGMSDIKVIFITGVFTETHFKLQVNCKYDGFIKKPIDVNQLIRLVEEKIGKS
jgi:CheY-like chemotaxis protein